MKCYRVGEGTLPPNEFLEAQIDKDRKARVTERRNRGGGRSYGAVRSRKKGQGGH